MKKFLFGFAFLTAAITSAQKVVPTEIQSVTLFQQGAQVVRSGTVQLPAGNNTVVFPYLTQNLDPNSVMLSGKGNLTILSISHENNYLTEEDKSAHMTGLESQLQNLQLAIARNKAEEDALNAEKSMITANQKIGGDAGVNVNQLQQTSSFFNQRIKAINLAVIDLLQTRKALEEQKAKLDMQLQEERQAFALKTGRVVVQVEVNAVTQAEFELSYLVNNAGWHSIYDARVSDLNNPVNLTHKARIVQQTGEDWKNVNLTLSTGIPSAGGQVPHMPPLYVYPAQSFSYDVRELDGGNRNANVIAQKAAPAYTTEDQAEAGYQSFNVKENITQQEYTIDQKQTLLSSPQTSTVVLRNMELPAVYEYHAKPRLDKDAFLIARVYDWDKYDLLSGELSLYNGETYVGKAYLNSQNPDDTLQLSLGRDQNIIVKRTRIKDKQEKTLLGSSKIDLFTYKLEVRNSKKNAVKLIVKDQVPLSKNEDIKVTVRNTENASYDEKTGIVEWVFNLNPGVQEEALLSYEIKYPKEMRIQYN